MGPQTEMKDNNRTADYLSSLEPEADELLYEMRTYAKAHDVPIVRLETESLLRTLVSLKAPRRILEIGTAVGYSTVVLARAALRAGESLKLITIESWEKRIPLARNNLERAGLSSAVELIHGDAGAVLQTLLKKMEQDGGEPFDFVFLDAAKGQYLGWLPDILSLMGEGAVLVADNVMQDMTVMESRFTVARRERTTHERMREFLYRLKHDPRLDSSVLPLGDGVSVSVKRRPIDG